VRTFSLVLEQRLVASLTQSAIVLVAASAVLLLTAVVQRYGVRRVVWAGWVAVVFALSVLLPLWFRGPAEALPALRARNADPFMVSGAERPGRVEVIALDAGSFDLITSATAEGRLPNFGRVLDAGAVTHLATLHPTSPEAVWAAFATGKLPQKNGIRSSAVYRVPGRPDDPPIELLPDFCFATGLLRYGALTEEPRTSRSIRARALWDILGGAGVSVGVLDFPLTAPAPVVQGYIVSDSYGRSALEGPLDATTVFPSDLHGEVAAAFTTVDEELLVPGSLDVLPERYRSSARADRVYDLVHRRLAATNPVDVGLVRYQSPDPIAHYFLRYAMPSRFGDVSEDERRRFGRVLETHYALVDQAIGRAIDAQSPGDLLLVVSGYGIEPLSVSKRILERIIGDPQISGTHEAAPDGFLMAYGATVAPNRQLRRGSVVDVLPTLLYFLGLPVGRDMDGYARTDLFQRTFTAERPIAFIPSYER
jgi:hypothetical protein